MRLFAERGWPVAAFAMHHPANEPSPWSRHFVAEIEYGRPYSWSEKLRKAGQAIYSLEARRNLAGLLDAFPAEIAHLHNIYHHLSPSILPVLKRRGLKTVMTAHDLKLACPAYRMHNGRTVCERCRSGFLLPCTLRRCLHGSLALSALVTLESSVHRLLGLYRRHLDAVVCPSRFYRDTLIAWGWPADRLVHIPNPVRGLDGAVAPVPPGRHVLHFGRLSQEKGLATLIRAAAAAAVPVVLAGEGPERAGLERLAAACGADIVFRGRLDGAALAAEIDAARACVLPSEWYENAPMSLVEAAARGRITLGAAIGGIPEMIRPGETGFLFKTGSVADLASRLREVATLPDVRLTTMGTAAAAFVRGAFGEAAYVAAMTDLYRSLGVRIPAGPP
ncbi:glycosyltransferase family 4 protein [Rhizobiales bacterium Sp-1]|uniref:Glycosyltransferase family 4 protein n=2 Tax=Segnochrobactrum spirostomi TaxID=2608987 RepID=A0A6A7Y724_9HYPH|nr:glycosyltransferase family 4 protein [Segnochrobactrum spirostomi]